MLLQESFDRIAASGASGEELSGLLWALWKQVVDAAVDPSTDQASLVGLLIGVRGNALFADLPLFGAQMREEWNLVPPDDRSVESWTRLNAFAARLTAAGVDFSLFGLWSIGTALETFCPVRLHLPAAVQWFEHCGPELVNATLHRRTFGPGPGRLHELAAREGLAEGGFNVPRWTFWRSRLESLADSDDPVARAGFRAVRRFDKQIMRGAL
ncbi:DUF3632 domain-containing protein [Actinoplanes bogorensis]|uniref:DUF3632 domain-containing protein n=1 Tax=Paractinoplanes bogorensis TaxID=1610840 RepID=A0ABS5YXV6_9ACTN|nr:DUF3632 domain-containing protein [Actinoplanes bogorensis]MBU2666945.1 DUF3632 domain-containing protein [Actinoplanes bogorensis]